MAHVKGAPTDLNLFALTELVRRNGGASEIPNRLERVDYPHIRRCLAGGLVAVTERRTLCLTDSGLGIVLRRLQEDERSFAPYATRSDRDRERYESIRRAIATLSESKS